MLTRLARIVGIMLGSLLVFVIVAAGGVYIASSTRLGRIHTAAAEPLTIPTDPASVERGRHLAVAAAHCAGCHGENMAGQVMTDVPPFRLVASNLTHGKGGLSTDYSDADFARAIRGGVHRDGTSLVIMPSDNFSQLSDTDVADIIAYVKSVSPVDSALPTTALHPLGRALLVAGKLNVLSAEEVAQAPARGAPVPAGATPAYGGYLLTIGGCRSCHGDTLDGGVVPDGSNIHAPNITPGGLRGWSQASFITAMREGKRPDGSTISPVMPWKEVGQLSDEELGALWLYLQSVPQS